MYISNNLILIGCGVSESYFVRVALLRLNLKLELQARGNLLDMLFINEFLDSC